jgi:hypothetical protein
MPPCNEATLERLRVWAATPELADVLIYRGVNLGEALEYHLFPAILETLLDGDEDRGR